LNSKEQWWNGQSSFDLVSGPELLRQWTIQLFGSESPAAAQIQSLADLTQSLWSKFNTLRDDLEREYMSNDKHLQAYLASFFIPNIERVRKVFLDPRNENQLEKIISKDTVHILDFGSGPLSASIGLLIALGEVKKRVGAQKFKCREFHICSVERSEKAFKKGKFLLTQAVSNDIQLHISRSTSIPRDRKFMAALAANVMNELPDRHRTHLALQFAQSLDSDLDNLGLILEPGQEQHSKNLSGIRDFLCANNQLNNFGVIAPCPHNKPCPLAPEKNRKDWCWFKSEFVAPPVLEQIDRKSKIQHADLAFSFFSFSTHTHAKESALSSPPAIAVSDEMPSGQASEQEKRFDYFRHNLSPSAPQPNNETLKQLASQGTKTKLCAASGDYLGGLRLTDGHGQTIKRGDVLQDLKGFKAIIRER
jgi:hypothetical protein